MKISKTTILLALVGCTAQPEPQETPHWSAVELLKEYHAKDLTEFDKLTLAIALTESRFNPDAVGTADDVGILQIRPIYVEEVNRISGANYSHEDAFDIRMSLDMFAAIQGHYNPQRDLDTAIRLHNKSAAYRKKVLDNLEVINRYEEIRSKLTER